ncbi:fucose permease [Parabacteroides sp. PF5-5]|uniref:MFS transporter n=1 Tax=unclassified Parabacteroides TaxID=2649774 RepID=UPI002474ABBF|nr:MULTISPECIES: MFS transporter [unclassified Parabacteroides]MDH6306768.1 fucose permease [Parabacteroides sp. PH5-39]MDH6317654.1 fucose permease [Parabacteroides sp. PF5-13]MDH6321480.1 fucose permease [Parabacteroides sp. PH5-13]MDH6325243.1 fucose permease [Parabacteroides sp. PH5-8]MDH6328839.1 fucose permease [Parabacteroides sp. PH5-41]
MKDKNMYWKIIPVMLSFFVMGFVDLVGIATNYVKADFDLSDTLANLFPSMVFFWFLICSVPTGMLMNRIGRRKTVLISLAVTIVSLILPTIHYSFVSMLLSFSLLGIGNALMQVSINPLLSNIVSNERLASSLTLGQFVKAIASFLAPIIAAWAAAQFNDWKYLYPIFMVVAVAAIIWLGLTQIKEQDEEGKTSTFAECFALLGDKIVLLSFLGIMCHVGIDVGVNVTAPKILIERLGMPLSDAGYATSLYFLFRTIGCLAGTFILAKYSQKMFFIVSVALLVIGFGGLFVFHSLLPIYVCIACIGVGNSNLFPIILSQAMLRLPEHKNEVSGLMIMGLFGGTIFPLLMGITTDAMGTQTGALIILSLAVLYLAFLAPKLKKQ